MRHDMDMVLLEVRQEIRNFNHDLVEVMFTKCCQGRFP